VGVGRRAERERERFVQFQKFLCRHDLRHVSDSNIFVNSIEEFGGGVGVAY